MKIYHVIWICKVWICKHVAVINNIHTSTTRNGYNKQCEKTPWSQNTSDKYNEVPLVLNILTWLDTMLYLNCLVYNLFSYADIHVFDHLSEIKQAEVFTFLLVLSYRGNVKIIWNILRCMLLSWIVFRLQF